MTLERASGLVEAILGNEDVHVGRRPAHGHRQPRGSIRGALQRQQREIGIGEGATEAIQFPEQRACRFRAKRPRAEETVPQPCRMRRAVASRGGHRGNAAAQPRAFRFAQQLFPLEARQAVEHSRIAKTAEQQAVWRHGLYGSGVRASCYAAASSSNSARASSRLL